MSGVIKTWVFFDARGWIARRRRRLGIPGLRGGRCRLAGDRSVNRQHRSRRER